MTFLNWYRNEFPVCQCSQGCNLQAWEIHEICGGNQHRQKARKSRTCILHLAGPCHAKLQGEPYAKGLARKLLADPEGLDLEEFCRIIGRAPGAVDMKDVVSYLEMAA